ncbi:MAG: nucleotidyltransferase domain-containing protein [bacterium]
MDSRIKSIIQDLTNRIVRIVNPDKIILFGSWVSGNSNPDSDLDVLVIKSGNIHRRNLAKLIYRGLFGLGKSVDIIVAKPEDIENSKDSPALFLYDVYTSGKVIYAR